MVDKQRSTFSELESKNPKINCRGLYRHERHGEGQMLQKPGALFSRIVILQIGYIEISR
jgi:hypothetical protein